MLTCEEMVPLMDLYYGFVDSVVIPSPAATRKMVVVVQLPGHELADLLDALKIWRL